MSPSTYDIIIIGAGTAGCVLANRLSEDPNVSVCVLEAGLDRSDDERVYTPGLAVQLLGNEEFDWGYLSVEEEGLGGRRMKHPRGKVVGGTSAINSFALIYPSRGEIDSWGMGADGWGWESLKGYFGKFQSIQGRGDMCGPIQASFPGKETGLQKAWVETWRSWGLENVEDPLGGKALGGYTSTCHISSDKRERSHAGVAYLGKDIREERGNLEVRTGVHVRKIIFEGDGNVAKGVLLQNDEVVYANKEIILAAGVFGSPQLLELSGVGDAEVLGRLGIPVVVENAAVGGNLQDHIRASISFEAKEGSAPTVDPEAARKLYKEERKGPWGEACCAFGYLPLGPFLEDEERRELERLVDGHEGWEYIHSALKSGKEAAAVAFLSRRPAVPDPKGRSWLTLSAMLSHPLSKGSVHVTSKEVGIKPRIQFNYYEDELDLHVHSLILQSLRKFAETEPLRGFLKPDGGRLGAEGEFDLEAAKKWVRETAMTNYHPCGTCALGSVVDGELRVKGTKGLRVVDASVLPQVTRGNIIATVYAVAEKGADLVKGSLGM